MADVQRNRTLMTGLIALAVGVLSARAVRPPERTPAPTEDYVEAAKKAPTDESGVRWVEDGGWDLPVSYNDRVGFWIDFLKGRNADRTQEWLERLGEWGPMIRGKLAERGMPEDLVYLAFIESGLSPNAYSKAAAAGMWQFIVETGRRYGLKVDAYVDERRDPEKATDAALAYLQDLHDEFGSWYLAAAAYNTGENRVERVLRQRASGRKGADSLFWKIDEYLPQETRDYVPLMLAAGFIGKDPARYGFTDLTLQRPFRYEKVLVPGGTPLATVAEAAGSDEDSLEALNPQLVRGMTPPGQGYHVRVPVGDEQVFAQNFERVYSEWKSSDRIELASHTIRRGETLSHVALRFGTTVAALQALNQGVSPRDLQVGQRIKVPVERGVGELASAAASGDSNFRSYRVRRGDSLWNIAQRHNVSVDQLREWNQLGRGSVIQPGQTLRIGV